MYILHEGAPYPVTEHWHRDNSEPWPAFVKMTREEADEHRWHLLRLSNVRHLTIDEETELQAVTKHFNVRNALKVLGNDAHLIHGFVGVDHLHGNHTHVPCGCVLHHVIDHHKHALLGPNHPKPHTPHFVCAGHAGYHRQHGHVALHKKLVDWVPPKPPEVVRIGEAVLYLGDLKQILPALGQVDAVVTDPHWDVGISYSRQFRQLVDLLAEHTRGPMAFGQKPEATHEFEARFPAGYKVCAQLDPFGPKNAYGKFADQTKFPLVVCRPPVDLPEVFEQTVNEWPEANAVGLPCTLPIEGLTKIIEAISKPGDTILDPWMSGSGGSTALAAIQAGRKYIGIDHFPDQFAVIRARIEAAQ
jgi:hypothetical protein